MSNWLIQQRYSAIWALRNMGLDHRAVARRLKMPVAKVRALIAESMDSEATDRLKFGEMDTPQHFYWCERFMECSQRGVVRR